MLVQIDESNDVEKTITLLSGDVFANKSDIDGIPYKEISVFDKAKEFLSGDKKVFNDDNVLTSDYKVKFNFFKDSLDFIGVDITFSLEELLVEVYKDRIVDLSNNSLTKVKLMVINQLIPETKGNLKLTEAKLDLYDKMYEGAQQKVFNDEKNKGILKARNNFNILISPLILVINDSVNKLLKNLYNKNIVAALEFLETIKIETTNKDGKILISYNGYYGIEIIDQIKNDLDSIL